MGNDIKRAVGIPVKNNKQFIINNVWRQYLINAGLSEVVSFIDRSIQLPGPNCEIIDEYLIKLGQSGLKKIVTDLGCYYGLVDRRDTKFWLLSYLLCLARRKLFILISLREIALTNNNDLSILCMNIVINGGALMADLSTFDKSMPGPITNDYEEVIELVGRHS